MAMHAPQRSSLLDWLKRAAQVIARNQDDEREVFLSEFAQLDLERIRTDMVFQGDMRPGVSLADSVWTDDQDLRKVTVTLDHGDKGVMTHIFNKVDGQMSGETGKGGERENAR